MGNEADGVSWYFELIDKISSPAEAMDRACGAVETALKQVDAAASQASKGGLSKWGETLKTMFGQGGPSAAAQQASILKSAMSGLEQEAVRAKALGDTSKLKELTAQWDHYASALGKIQPQVTSEAGLQKIGTMLAGAGGFLLSAVTTLVETGAAVAAGIALTLAGLAAAGFRFAMESADAKRDILFSLSSAVGSQSGGLELMEELETYAKRTGLAKDTVTTSIRQLLGAGFDKSETKQLVGALSDVQAMNGGDAAATQAMLGQLVRLKTMPKVSTRELFAFGQLGISSDAIYSAVAAQKHVTVAQAKALFDAGEVNTNAALNAVMTAIREKAGGKLGALGEQFQAGSLSAQVQHLKDAFGDLFENVNMKPVTDFLQRLNAAMGDPEVAERFGGAVNKAFGMITSLFSGISGGDMKGVMLKIADGFNTAVDWAMKFFGAVKEGWDAVKGPIGDAVDRISALQSAATNTSGASSAVTELFEATARIAEVFLRLYEWKIRIDNFVGQMMAAGSNLVDGLWQGITSGWASMMAKFHVLVEQLPASVKRILGIASPSKVFEELGRFTAQGFTLGLDAGDMQDGMRSAISAPSAPIVDRAALSSAVGGARTIVISPSFDVTVHASNQEGEHMAQEIGEELQRIVLPALITAIEQADLEGG